MTIRAKLQLSTLIEIVLVIIVGSVLAVSSFSNDRANNKLARAAKINEAITEMRFVTVEQLLRHDERSLEQWNLQYSVVNGLLVPLPSHNIQERQILEHINQQHTAIRAIFDRLVGSYAETKSPQDQMFIKEFQERLASQLLVKQQVQVTDAGQLTSQGQAQVKTQQERSNSVILLVILLMFSVTALNALLITRNINRSFKLLQKGAEAIAGGHLQYRIRNRDNDEFGRLATDFNSMAVNLEGFDRIKSEFILLASHQLRTPLTAIKWSSEELTSGDRPLSKKQRDNYLKHIHASNERMIKLVTALLNVAKIDLGALPHKAEKISLETTLDEVMKDLSALTHDKEIIINKKITAKLPDVYMDPAWARIVFQNLLSNAVKYSTNKQAVTVSMEHKDDNVLVTFQDNGCGIPAAQQDRIFTKLFRADNALRLESDGSGLGLYICRAMVLQTGGNIWFESVENQGTTFYVTLPITHKRTNRKGNDYA